MRPSRDGGNIIPRRAEEKVFFAMVDRVRDAVRSTVSGISSQSSVFYELRGAISEYLSYGVVPSRIVSEGKAITPSSVAIVNAAHLFYLEPLDVLLGRIRGSRADCLECRTLWSERVEMWTSEALEGIT
jgi:hypothetical protein